MAVINIVLIFIISPKYNPHIEIRKTMYWNKVIVLVITYLLIVHSFSLLTLDFKETLLYLLLTLLVTTAAMIDASYMVIPDRLLVVFVPSIILLKILIGQILEGVIGGAFIFTFLLLLAILLKGGIGGGDIKLFTVIGLGTSFTFIYQLLFISCFIAFCFGLVTIFLGKRKKKEMVPFGPTIAMSTILLFFYF